MSNFDSYRLYVQKAVFTQRIFKFNFLKNEATYEETLFYIFNYVLCEESIRRIHSVFQNRLLRGFVKDVPYFSPNYSIITFLHRFFCPRTSV